MAKIFLPFNHTTSPSNLESYTDLRNFKYEYPIPHNGILTIVIRQNITFDRLKNSIRTA